MHPKVRALDVRIFSHRGILLSVIFALVLPYLTHCSQESQGKAKLEQIKFSNRLDDDDGFKPISPKPSKPDNLITEIFTKNGQFKVFAKKDASLLNLSSYETSNRTTNNLPKYSDEVLQTNGSEQLPPLYTTPNPILNTIDKEEENEFDMKQLEEVLINYLNSELTDDSFKLFSTFHTNNNSKGSIDNTTTFYNISEEVEEVLAERLYNLLETNLNNINKPRAVETGRLFFFKGLKKILWPVFIGVQIAKTILLALFLPSILGSIGKIVGKGISSVSGFNRPSETVSDLDFKDNTYNFDQDNMKYNDYTYPQPEASNHHFVTQMYDAAAINNNALSRFGVGDQKEPFSNAGVGMYNSKNNLMSSNKNTFQVFHDIPASSLLLSNYDPFYSPLLSRLDAVFQQLGLGSGNEPCREKLVCLMYANPAKYAPYSNLVSAQLSRELNELRKPTSDNPDILRFFKYMKAAKDGQDGVNCEEAYRECTNFKESENPAMLATYHDINKLVQARKLRK